MRRLIGIAGLLAVASMTPVHAQSMPTGLQGVKIAVEDYERATRFYEILGMTLGMKYNAKEWQLRWKEPATGQPIIMVNDPTGRISVPKGGAFLMISVADVPTTVAELRAAGFSVPGEPHSMPQATLMMIKDPDGNSIELLGGPFGADTPAAAQDHGLDDH